MLPSEFTPKLWSLLKNGYSLSDFRSDLFAGLTVAIIALPLAMAFAIAGGASPDKGLITAVIAGGMISLLGGSRVQIGGPTGSFIVVVSNVIHSYGYNGLLMATVLAGVILIIAGYCRLGIVIKYIPYSVIIGFTTGIAMIIVSSQIKDFLGLKIEKLPADFVPKWKAYFQYIQTFSWESVLVGLGTLFLVIGLKKYAKRLPAYLIAVIVASLFVVMLDSHIDTIGSKFSSISSGVPSLNFPKWTSKQLREVVPSAFALAFLAGIEALLSAIVADGMGGFKHRPNQELVGQGLANIASACFGGLPAAGAIARTATNIRSGAKTPMAGVFHALFVLMFMVLASEIMGYIPLAALSAILFVVAWNMSESHHVVRIFKCSPTDRAVMLLTFLLTVLIDLTVAIGVGVSLASLIFLHQMSKSIAVHAQGRKATDVLVSEHEDITQRVDLPVGVEVFRITGPVFFSISNVLLDALKNMDEMPEVLIVRMKLVPHIDIAGVNALDHLVRQCREKKTKVIFTGLQPHPRKMLEKIGIVEDDKTLFFMLSYDEAISLAQEIIERRSQELLS